ncbi:GNAT family N-acetyltransferase [Belnapia sp. T18]|uniref:GNAT family N-acetyltransferase n=2 Tax=Belnapia arida TaxID=2804533 RepID=A0ABS1U1T2_9PROT|nr:GNAT family N-acetyltransferase [Belnapia arida]
MKRWTALQSHSSDLSVVPSGSPDKDRQWILDRLVAFNESKAGPSGFRPYVILLQEEAGKRTLGGLAGMSFYDWFYVELVFVPEHVRHAGWGTQLLSQAEAEAVRRNCVGIWLDTYGFQARRFYERRGYEVFGALDDHPRGSQRCFMRKMLG